MHRPSDPAPPGRNLEHPSERCSPDGWKESRMVLGSMAPRRRWLLLGLTALAAVALIAAGAVVITRLTGDSKPTGAPVTGAPTRRRAARRPRAPAALHRARTSPARSTCCWSAWTPGSACPVGSRTVTPCWCCTYLGVGSRVPLLAPRDLLVDIPAFPKADYRAARPSSPTR
ncbi:hypothetical protein NKG94_41410 [Micromonospora sp. M12]